MSEWVEAALFSRLGCRLADSRTHRSFCISLFIIVLPLQSFKPIKIPEATAAPVKASRGRPRTRGGLAATGGRRSAAAASTQQRQSGRKRKTVTYDEVRRGDGEEQVALPRLSRSACLSCCC